MAKTVINLKDLQEITNRLFDHIIKEKGVEAIELEEDFYWKIPTHELYNLKHNPSMLHVGSLYDQWVSVKRLKAREEAVPHKLAELAPLLGYIAEALTRKQK